MRRLAPGNLIQVVVKLPNVGVEPITFFRSSSTLNSSFNTLSRRSVSIPTDVKKSQPIAYEGGAGGGGIGADGFHVSPRIEPIKASMNPMRNSLE